MILPSTNDAYNRRMTKAASTLVIRLPFFGYLLFGSAVRVVEKPELRTMATDGVRVMCGTQFVLTEDIDVVVFGLLHELLHVYLAHHGRRGDRRPHLWNIAADIYVNWLCSVLLGTGSARWPIPPQFIQPEEWASDKLIEEIYELLLRLEVEDPQKILDFMANDTEIGNGTDMQEPSAETAEATASEGAEDPDGLGAQGNPTWQDTFREDVARAKGLAENTPTAQELPHQIRARMDKILRPTLPWGSLLRGNLADTLGWDTQTYAPPKMRYYPIILPQTLALKERVLVLGIDVSASVTQELIRIFISNVESAAYRATKTVVVTFDQVVREVHTATRPRDIFAHVKFNSGAHSYTSAMGVFEVADKVNPSAICVLTDGHIVHPETPYKNTLWVIPEGGARLPWGRVFVMEHPWR